MTPIIEQETAKRQVASRTKQGEKIGSKVTQKNVSPTRNKRTAAAKAAAIVGKQT